MWCEPECTSPIFIVGPNLDHAHHEFFAEHPPATTMVEVQRLIDPAMLIEIEADAILVNNNP